MTAFATSYIKTTSAAATRLADSATITGTNFSSWYNQTEGVVLFSGDVAAPSSTGFNRLWQVDAGSNNDEMSVNKNNGTGSTYFGYVAVGGSAQALLNTTAVTANTLFKIAFAYKANDFAQSFNGATVQTDVSGSLPTVNKLSIGSALGFDFINGHIQRLSYYRARLSNASLQSLTT
jgi:hypothetical protein